MSPPGAIDDACVQALRDALAHRRSIGAAVSISLYSTRLCWYGYYGAAKLQGRLVALSEPPAICGARVEGIDYIPEVGMQRIQPRTEGWRDMTADEVESADDLLGTLLAPDGEPGTTAPKAAKP